MKRITLLFFAIIACLAMAVAQSEADTAMVQQSVTDTQIEYTDTPDNNRTSKKFFTSDYRFDSDTAISIIAVICVFGLPVMIVFIAFFFKYKNRKEKYRLAEQALAAGQPIPEEIFRGKAESGTLQKGITNTFTGIGLFIFLWAITGAFSIGCIGLLVMFTGIGQVVVHYTTNKKDEAKDSYKNRENNATEE